MPLKFILRISNVYIRMLKNIDPKGSHNLRGISTISYFPISEFNTNVKNKLTSECSIYKFKYEFFPRMIIIKPLLYLDTIDAVFYVAEV